MSETFDAERLREVLTGQRADPKAWAYRLRRREHLLEPLSITQRTMWRAALKTELEAERSVQEAA